MERKRSKSVSDPGPGAFKARVRRFTTPTADLDRQALTDFTLDLGTEPLDEVQPRSTSRIGGEVSSVRIVPRAGAPALEVTLSDGRGLATGVFLGRRHIAGITPGRRMVMEGMVSRVGTRNVVVNPIYTLLG
jgi:hypothetical protein